MAASSDPTHPAPLLPSPLGSPSSPSSSYCHHSPPSRAGRPPQEERRNHHSSGFSSPSSPPLTAAAAHEFRFSSPDPHSASTSSTSFSTSTSISNDDHSFSPSAQKHPCLRLPLLSPASATSLGTTSTTLDPVTPWSQCSSVGHPPGDQDDLYCASSPTEIDFPLGPGPSPSRLPLGHHRYSSPNSFLAASPGLSVSSADEVTHFNLPLSGCQLSPPALGSRQACRVTSPTQPDPYSTPLRRCTDHSIISGLSEPSNCLVASPSHSLFLLPPLTAPSNSEPPATATPSHHRRYLSQPSTPLPVKETFHGSLSDHPLNNGQRQLNQYLLLKTIGRGSYGSVELAQDLNSPTNQLYAIKEYSKSRLRRLRQSRSHQVRRGRRPVPQPVRVPSVSSDASSDQAQSSEGMELVKAEVAIMKKLAHLNIATLIEVIDTDEDSLFFVLELCPFGPIIELAPHEPREDRIKRPNLSLTEAQARNIFQQIILGIEYLHFNHILHRDIKPDNVLYFEDPKTVERPICKIVDFGVSQSFPKAGDDPMDKSAGSPGFLAPEICSGNEAAVPGKMVDIWAMGITLYALVCGNLPFEDSDPLRLYERIVQDELVLPDNLSAELKDVLNRLLEKAPEKRIQMTELRVHPWVTAGGQEPLPDETTNMTPIAPPTEQEIAQAFKSMRSFATVFKAISKFRSKRKTSSIMSGASTGDERTTASSTTSVHDKSETPQNSTGEYVKQLVGSPMGGFDMRNLPVRRTSSNGMIHSQSSESSAYSILVAETDDHANDRTAAFKFVNVPPFTRERSISRPIAFVNPLEQITESMQQQNI